MSHVASHAQTIHATRGVAPLTNNAPTASSTEQTGQATEVLEALNGTFNKMLYDTLLSSMRKTVGKPAYFHGGRAEEVFRGQLDQQIADHLSANPSADLLEGAFEHQFPQLNDAHAAREQAHQLRRGGLEQLATLRRR